MPVTLIGMLSIGEGSGMVQVCATKASLEVSQRNVIITLASSDGTGWKINTLIHWM